MKWRWRSALAVALLLLVYRSVADADATDVSVSPHKEQEMCESVWGDYRFQGNIKNSAGNALPLSTGSGESSLTYSNTMIDDQEMQVVNFDELTNMWTDDYYFSRPEHPYTIHMVVRFDDLGGRMKVLDFSDLSSDNGFYMQDGIALFQQSNLTPLRDDIKVEPVVQFANLTQPVSIKGDEWMSITFVRDASFTIKIFLNGNLVLSFDDKKTADAVFKEGKISFFRGKDGGCTPSGQAARILIFQREMSPIHIDFVTAHLHKYFPAERIVPAVLYKHQEKRHHTPLPMEMDELGNRDSAPESEPVADIARRELLEKNLATMRKLKKMKDAMAAEVKKEEQIVALKRAEEREKEQRHDHAPRPLPAAHHGERHTDDSSHENDEVAALRAKIDRLRKEKEAALKAVAEVSIRAKAARRHHHEHHHENGRHQADLSENTSSVEADPAAAEREVVPDPPAAAPVEDLPAALVPAKEGGDMPAEDEGDHKEGDGGEVSPRVKEEEKFWGYFPMAGDFKNIGNGGGSVELEDVKPETEEEGGGGGGEDGKKEEELKAEEARVEEKKEEAKEEESKEEALKKELGVDMDEDAEQAASVMEPDAVEKEKEAEKAKEADKDIPAEAKKEADEEVEKKEDTKKAIADDGLENPNPYGEPGQFKQETVGDAEAATDDDQQQVYVFEKGEGLVLHNDQFKLRKQEYTIFVLFRLSDTRSYKSIINFENEQNGGVYILDGRLVFFPKYKEKEGDVPLKNDEWIHITITRTALDEVKVYLNGERKIFFKDYEGDALSDPKNGTIAFFKSHNENYASGGEVSLVVTDFKTVDEHELDNAEWAKPVVRHCDLKEDSCKFSGKLKWKHGKCYCDCPPGTKGKICQENDAYKKDMKMKGPDGKEYDVGIEFVDGKAVTTVHAIGEKYDEPAALPEMDMTDGKEAEREEKRKKEEEEKEKKDKEKKVKEELKEVLEKKEEEEKKAMALNAELQEETSSADN